MSLYFRITEKLALSQKKEAAAPADKIIDTVIHGEKMKWNVTKWGNPPEQKPLTPRNRAHEAKRKEQTS